MKAKEMGISIIICTINVDFAERMLQSLVGKIKKDDEVLLIVDGRKYITSNKVLDIIKANNWRVIINEENQGLSYSRNVAMNEMINDYCIFFDDDTVITDGVIERYRKHFNDHYDMVGGLLKLPEHYPKLPKWFPDGMSSLLGIHTFQYKIWGANFGFNVKFAKENNLTFIQKLGRKGKGLQSGDDTTFIKTYCEKGKEQLFDKEIVVYHYVNENRYKLKYMIRRAYWQGISEVRRNSFIAGLKKEAKRAMQIDLAHNKMFIVPKFGVSVMFIIVFLIGAFVEKISSLFAKLG